MVQKEASVLATVGGEKESESTMNYFSIDIEGDLHWHRSEKEAISAAENHLGDCMGADGWEHDEEEISGIGWGMLHARMGFTVDSTRLDWEFGLAATDKRTTT